MASGFRAQIFLRKIKTAYVDTLCTVNDKSVSADQFTIYYFFALPFFQPPPQGKYEPKLNFS